jgi:hypothetical protein
MLAKSSTKARLAGILAGETTSHPLVAKDSALAAVKTVVVVGITPAVDLAMANLLASPTQLTIGTPRLQALVMPMPKLLVAKNPSFGVACVSC